VSIPFVVSTFAGISLPPPFFVLTEIEQAREAKNATFGNTMPVGWTAVCLDAQQNMMVMLTVPSLNTRDP
jgi:hypothetical protein